METETKTKKKSGKNIVIGAIAIIIVALIVIIATSGGDKEDTSSDKTDKVMSGELLDVNINETDNIAVVKVKIDTGLGGDTAVTKNYYNVADLIKNKGYDKYDEVQYWAVADTTDGGETKVISFTVSKELISKIKNNEVVDNQLGDYVDDLWIIDALK